MRRPLLVLWLAVMLPASLLAQDPQTLPVGTRVGATPASGYDDGGRRDPFVSLVAPKKAPASVAPVPARPATGLAAVAISDVIVKGIMRSGTNLVAILESPDGKGYLARRQDKLQDGTIKSIDATGVVFAAQVIDVSGSTHLRDVRKPLHTSEIAR